MYYIIGTDGAEYGPVNADELRRWIAEGRANAESRARAAGVAEWRPLRDFPEFAPDVNPGPRSTPPLFSAQPAMASEPVGRTNGLAVAGFLFGVSGFCCCPCGPLFPLAGLILSLTALSQLNANSTQSGRGLAIAGLVLSGFCLLGSIGLWSFKLMHLGRPLSRFPFI